MPVGGCFLRTARGQGPAPFLFIALLVYVSVGGVRAVGVLIFIVE